MDCTFGILSKKSSPRFSPMLPSSSLIVLHFTLSSMIPFLLISIPRMCFVSIILHKIVQIVVPIPLLRLLSFFNWTAFTHLSKISWLSFCGSMSRFFSVRYKDLLFCQYHPVLILFGSVAQSCQTLCHPMDCSTPGFPVHHQLPELAQTHVYRVSDTIQPFNHLLSPSPPAFNLSSIRVFSLNKVLKSAGVSLLTFFFSILGLLSFPINLRTCLSIFTK